MSRRWTLASGENRQDDEESAKESLTSEEEESLTADSPDASLSLQLGGSVYDDAWLAPLVGLYGGTAPGRKHPWHFSFLLLVLNLVIQGMLLFRIGGEGGLLDEAQERVDRLISEPFEAELTDGICVLSQVREFDNTTWPRGLPPMRVGETTYDCSSVDARYAESFEYLDLDGDGFWTADEAARTKPKSGYKADIPAIHANMLGSLRKAAFAVKESQRFAASLEAVRQAQYVIDQLAQREDSITGEVFKTQVRPFAGMCSIGDPLLCGNFMLRNALNRTEFMEPLRSRGFQSPPLLFLANNWMGADEVRSSMTDICKVALEKICPAILSAREAQFRAVVKSTCGVPTVRSFDRADVLGGRATSFLVTRYSEEEVFSGTVLTKMYIGFLALILLFWILSMLDEFNQLVTWWRVHFGLLFCTSSSAGYVKFEDKALEVVVVPKWFAACGLFLNVLPRTLIFLALTVFGTIFLLSAASFNDLIMNGVALTFLITVDEVMFMAVVPSVRKDWIGMAKPVTPPAQPRADRVLNQFVNEVFWVLFLVIVLTAVLYWEYNRSGYGKYDLGHATRCLCQGAGRYCALARNLGGYPDIPTALAAWGV